MAKKQLISQDFRGFREEGQISVSPTRRPRFPRIGLGAPGSGRGPAQAEAAARGPRPRRRSSGGGQAETPDRLLTCSQWRGIGQAEAGDRGFG